MLRNKNLSNYSMTATAVALMLGYPAIFPCSDPAVNVYIRVTSLLFLVLKVLEIGTFNRHFNSKWALRDYVEYMWSSSNIPIRLLELKQSDLQRTSRCHVIGAGHQTLAFYMKLVVRLFLSWIAYSIAISYFQKYPYTPASGWFLNLSNPKEIVDHAMFGVLTYCFTGIIFNGLLPVFVILNAPFVPIFNEPFLATSLRDFWSNRWNSLIKTSIHRVAFIPTLKLLKSLSSNRDQEKPTHSEKQHKQPDIHYMIAVMASFTFSALYHEYLIFNFFTEPSLGENFCFFMLQGIFCVIQVYFQKLTGFGKTWGRGGVFWNFVGWSCTMGLLLITSPMFVGPYARFGVFFEPFVIPVYGPFNNIIQKVI
ncbi:hypothetical protein BDR26DRAFT_282137 [Obelidium mucronatum]|nr:hypothetical protein BDR26DRAFT_282137 [Obelidium mucronatum]